MEMLPHEIFDKVEEEKTEKGKIKALQTLSTWSSKTMLQVAYRDGVELDLPEGAPPFQKLTTITKPYKRRLERLTACVKSSGAPKFKKEQQFIWLLETIHEQDANVLIACKDKKLTDLYPSITKELVKTALPKLL